MLDNASLGLSKYSERLATFGGHHRFFRVSRRVSGSFGHKRGGAVDGMTEQQWLESGDLREMLEFLRNRASERKLRLFAVACCRHLPWSLELLQEESAFVQPLVKLAESFADGLLTRDEARVAQAAAQEKAKKRWDHLQCYVITAIACLEDRAIDAARIAADIASEIAYEAYVDKLRDSQAQEACEIPMDQPAAGWLRDICGNPFRSVTFSLGWRTDTAVSMARQMYESQDFDGMPILADALQDAGCDNAPILEHCRGPGPHVRGCWAVDLILAKE
jgi:hypothetical protein